MREAGREYWLTYSSAQGAATAPLYDKGLINFRTFVAHWAGVAGICSSVLSAVIHSEIIFTKFAGR